MKLALFNQNRIGVVDEASKKVADVTQIVRDHEIPLDMIQVITNFESISGDFVKNLGVARKPSLADLALMPPVPNPSKILCALSNFLQHSKEYGRRPPSKPELFLKAPSSIIGPGGEIVLPRVDYSAVHHEAELAAIIGKKAKDVNEENALDYVFGYTGFMDISARGLNDHEFTMLFRMKSFDTFGPLGPFITTKDEIRDPQDIDIKLWVNGQLKQEANTRDMVHKIPALIAYASSAVTLLPGDIISSGSPQGVGEIKDGDTVKLAISKIGEMEVHVTKAR